MAINTWKCHKIAESYDMKLANFLEVPTEFRIYIYISVSMSDHRHVWFQCTANIRVVKHTTFMRAPVSAVVQWYL